MLSRTRVIFHHFEFFGLRARVLLGDIKIACVGCADEPDLQGGWLCHGYCSYKVPQIPGGCAAWACLKLKSAGKLRDCVAFVKSRSSPFSCAFALGALAVETRARLAAFGLLAGGGGCAFLLFGDRATLHPA